MAATQVREVFGDVSLYEILGVPKTADATAIKKGFYRKSLSYHPDKDPSPGAKDRFQALCFVHSVLSDPDKRAEYDRTGSLEDAEDATNEEAFAAWYSYWRGMFPAVTTDDIVEFEKSYRGSAEEAADVLAAYAACKGDMEEMLTVVMCSNAGDADRFAAMVHAAIAAGAVKALPAFTAVFGKSADDASSAPKAAARAKAAAARSAAASAEAAAAEEMLAEARRQYKADAKAAKAGAIVVRGARGGKATAAAAVSDDDDDEGVGSSAGAGARASGGAGSASVSAGSSSRGKGASASAGSAGSAGSKKSAAAAGAAGKARKAGKASSAAAKDVDDDDDDDGPEPSLEDLIRMRSSQRAAGFGGLLSSLEAKYGGGGSGSGKASKGSKAAKGKGRGGTKAAKADDSGDEGEEKEEEEAGSAPAPSTKRGRKA